MLLQLKALTLVSTLVRIRAETTRVPPGWTPTDSQDLSKPTDFELPIQNCMATAISSIHCDTSLTKCFCSESNFTSAIMQCNTVLSTDSSIYSYAPDYLRKTPVFISYFSDTPPVVVTFILTTTLTSPTYITPTATAGNSTTYTLPGASASPASAVGQTQSKRTVVALGVGIPVSVVFASVLMAGLCIGYQQRRARAHLTREEAGKSHEKAELDGKLRQRCELWTLANAVELEDQQRTVELESPCNVTET
ncbi:hypothetical protein EJ04DRAFT_565037 [Polyplosphaeria fusca]|uniref:Extracellular membrane protein CFEM domain-containing protein n=1 Tax=Polyplosphaeria fusca TaxID=682080 RepID=A0A9P4QTC3_9PLEO|nr:hypothetical protein EJ04DRAFT_565037 [Polyplosphaeria fusca]